MNEKDLVTIKQLLMVIASVTEESEIEEEIYHYLSAIWDILGRYDE